MKSVLLWVFISLSMSAFAGGWKVINGNEVSKTETREASDFTALASGGFMQVDIDYGDSKTIRLEGEENLLPYIETEVKDNMLTVKIKEGYTLKNHQPVKIYVSMNTISALAQSGSGSIKGEGNFNNNGNTSVAVSGSGSLAVKFASFGSLSARISGSGTIRLSGNVDNETDVKQSGSGSADIENVGCKNATVQLSGSGSLHIHADKALTAQISGSGSVYYSGDATVASKVSGSGRVRKV